MDLFHGHMTIDDMGIGLCRRHWMAGDLGPDFDINRV